MKVRRYIVYMNEEMKKGSQRGSNLIDSLSLNLIKELKYESYAKIFREIKIFQEYFSPEFLNALCIKMVEIVHAPEEIVCLVIRFSNLLLFLHFYFNK